MMQSKTNFVHSWVNGFWEYFPDAWDKKTPLPLVVFFHGIGETFPRKTLQDYSNVGLPLKIKQSGMPKDCIVFMPQLNKDWAGGATIQAIIDWAMKNYAVDPNRVYLTGLSMGGGSIMDWADAGKVETVAAMVPICPASWYNGTFAQRYVDNKMPIRFYHADDDTTVDPSSSKSWMDGLNKMGITPQVTRVLYDGTPAKPIGHNCWDLTYNDAAMWDWVFAQTKAVAPVKEVEALLQFPSVTYTLYKDSTYIKT